MTQYFILRDAEKLKNGKICYRGVLTFVAELCDDDDDGDGGNPPGGRPPGGDRVPPFRIEIPKHPADVVWVYEDGTPDWAIKNAEAVGYETVHNRDWFPHKPI